MSPFLKIYVKAQSLLFERQHRSRYLLLQMIRMLAVKIQTRRVLQTLIVYSMSQVLSMSILPGAMNVEFHSYTHAP